MIKASSTTGHPRAMKLTIIFMTFFMDMRTATMAQLFRRLQIVQCIPEHSIFIDGGQKTLTCVGVDNSAAYSQQVAFGNNPFQILYSGLYGCTVVSCSWSTKYS